MAKTTTSRTTKKTSSVAASAKVTAPKVESARISPAVVEQPKTLQTHSHWVKQMYYYAVLGFCVFFISLGTFMLVRSNLVKYVFPEVDDYSYIASQCKYEFKAEGQIEKSAEEQKKCEEDDKNLRNVQQTRNYQRDMINGILLLIIPSVVLGFHTRFVKIK